MNSELKCKCNGRPKFFCQSHKTFICHSEMAAHNCPLVPVDQFLKRTDSREAEFALAKNGLQSRANSFRKTLSSCIDEKVSKLKEKCRALEKNMAKCVEIYQQLLTNYCANLLEKSLEAFAEELEYLNKANGLLTLDSSFSQVSLAKINKENTEIETRILSFIEKESYFQISLSYLSSLAAEAELFGASVQALRGSDLLQHAELGHHLARKLGLLRLQAGSGFVRSYLEFLDGRAARSLLLVLKSNLNSFSLPEAEGRIPNRCEISPQGRVSFGADAPNKRSFFEEDTDEGVNAENFRALRGKGVSEIFGPIDLEGQISPKISRGLVGQGNFVFRGKSANKSENFDEDLNFVLDEIEIGQSLEFTAEGVKEAFQVSVFALCRLLDHVLADLNSSGFFDRKHKEKISLYLDQLVVAMKESIVALKNNFNKL